MRRQLKRIQHPAIQRGLSLSFGQLVGAVSMPLSITLDALVLKRVLVVDMIYTMNFLTSFVLYTFYRSSFLCGDCDIDGVQGYCYFSGSGNKGNVPIKSTVHLETNFQFFGWTARSSAGLGQKGHVHISLRISFNQAKINVLPIFDCNTRKNFTMISVTKLHTP